jgi:hypothetical protein
MSFATTESAFILTNSIDTVIAGTLTIGGANTTSVSMPENVTVTGTLGATTVTATGGITTPLPILLSYATVPTFTSNQIGYQEVRTLISNSAPLVSNVSTNLMTSISLGVGVWNISFGVRFIATDGLPTPLVTVTSIQTLVDFSVSTVVGAFRMPETIGLTNMVNSFSVTDVNNLAINDSVTITNNTAGNVMNLQVRVVFSTANSSNIVLLGSTIIPPDIDATPNTYLIATRIG